jgi:hypothetical protein
MTVEVMQIQPRDKMNKVFARLSVHDPDGPPHNSATVDVFVEHSDSYAEIRSRAVEAARAFFSKALASGFAEHPPSE